MLIIFSTLISGWTTIVLLSNTSFKTEIEQVLNKMYLNQKDFIFNVKTLSIFLLKDTNERFYKNEIDISTLSNTSKQSRKVLLSNVFK